MPRIDTGPLAQPAPTSSDPAVLRAELQRRQAEVAELRETLERLRRHQADELRLAASVQRALLPAPRDFEGLELAREFLPYREVGGDYYDFVELAGGRVAIAIGDVMGKGAPAALLVANLKSSLRSQLRAGDFGPAELVTRINRLYHEVAPPGRFASFFVGILELASGQLDFVNAGHDYPFVVREDGSAVDLVEGGPALGLIEAARYEAGRVLMRRGDLMVLFTDGVTDQTNAKGEPYGPRRLRQAAAPRRADPCRIALYSLLGEVQGWSDGCPAEDDRTLLVVKRT